MNLKRKALAAAVFAGLGVGAAHAANISANGAGQFLIFPYYTVQQAGGNSYNTYISVVNTTTAGKAVKVRFREGKSSREVLDFNLFLSPNDVWTGAVIPADSTTSSPGRLITADKSCTNPAIPSTGVDFRNYVLGDATDFVKITTLDRTREGYLEMFEMATVIDVAPRNQLTGITHVSDVPANCAAVQGAAVAIDTAAPTGGLTGTGTLINVNNGADMGYNAVPIAAFRQLAIAPTLGSEQGNLTDADPWSLLVNNVSGLDNDERIYRANFPATAVGSIDAISSLFMATSITNEHILDAGTKSATDWVVTFPTKRYYYASATPFTARAPFTTAGTTAGACETISFTYFNREERGAAAAGADFSPVPPAGPSSSMCWESTVLGIRNSGAAPSATAVLGSANLTDVNLTQTGIQNGWARLSFTGTNAVVGAATGLLSLATSYADNWTTTSPPAPTAGSVRFFGLPVTGFMLRTFNNGTLTCGSATCQGNYGSAFVHNYERTISPAP